MAMYRALHVCLQHAHTASMPRTAFKVRNDCTIQTRYMRIKNAGSNGVAAKSKQPNDIKTQVEIHTSNKMDTSKRRVTENIQGGYLPLVFAGLTAFGALLVGVAAVANSVVVFHQGEEKLEEEKRHNIVTEQSEYGRHLNTYRDTGCSGKAKTATDTGYSVLNHEQCTM